MIEAIQILILAPSFTILLIYFVAAITAWANLKWVKRIIQKEFILKANYKIYVHYLSLDGKTEVVMKKDLTYFGNPNSLSHLECLFTDQPWSIAHPRASKKMQSKFRIYFQRDGVAQ